MTGTTKPEQNDYYFSLLENPNFIIWKRTIAQYSFLFIIVIAIGAMLSANSNIFHTELSSSQYLLSALGQCQAAIISIVITLTLVAVQLTTASFTPRVINIFKKNPDMWILITIYTFAISFNFILLKLLNKANIVPFEIYISFAYWFGIFTFLSLFLYMWNTITLMDTKTILTRFADEIKIRKPEADIDPFQPIFDIIYSAVLKFDLSTMSIGFSIVNSKFNSILMTYPFRTIEYYSFRFFDDYNRVGQLLIDRKEDKFTHEVIFRLNQIGEFAVYKELSNVTLVSVETMEKIAIQALNNQFRETPNFTIRTISELAKKLIEKEPDINYAGMVVYHLGNVGKFAARLNDRGCTILAINELKSIGEISLEKEIFALTNRVVISLVLVGTAAVHKNYPAFETAVENLIKIQNKKGGIVVSQSLVDMSEMLESYYSDSEKQERDYFDHVFKRVMDAR